MHFVEAAAKRIFGLTTDYRTAGFMLTDGAMLDFSGAHWLDKDFYSEKEISEWRKKNNIRQVDHDDISEVVWKFKEDISDCRGYFMELGAIRLNPEAPGINVFAGGKEPTREQYRALKDFIIDLQSNRNFYFDTFYVDIEEKYPDKIAYRMPFSADKVINDLKEYYRTGIKPQLSTGMTECA